MPKIVFSPPEVIGNVSPDFLTGLAEAFPKTEEQAAWYRDPKLRPYNPKLLVQLEPFQAIIWPDAMHRFKGNPLGIGYELYTTDVGPNRTQTSLSWHQDPWPVYIAFNSLAPIFVIRDELATNSRQQRRARRQFAQASWPKEIEEKTLAATGLRLYSPDDLKVVSFNGQRHKPRKNKTAEPIPRVLAHAHILFKHDLV